VLALLVAVFAVLFTVQATKPKEVNVTLPRPGPIPGDAKGTFDAQCAKCHGKNAGAAYDAWPALARSRYDDACGRMK